ncbi:MAG: hypothetical protein HQL78_00650 [Magnetococcales bacterium]|nr:hypothetical protein [Magnetococcales bacterium]
MTYNADPLTPKKRLLFSLVTLLVSMGLFVLGGEFLLRHLGYWPVNVKSFQTLDLNEPTLMVFDPDTGWRNKPGHHVLPPYTPQGQPIAIHILENGARDTGPAPARPEGTLLLVGCSYLFGWALSDHQTLGWKLQEKYPRLQVFNHATSGFGTLQSLILLEQILPKLPPPVHVIYGIIEHHQVRNVAPASWMAHLESFTKRGTVFLPYVTLDGSGTLVRHSPERYLHLPLRQTLSLARFVESLAMELITWRRSRQGEEGTRELIKQMADFTSGHKASFHVLLLEGLPNFREKLLGFLKSSQIASLNCPVPDPKDDRWRVAGEGHPNEAANDLWLNCIQASSPAWP